MSKFIPLPVFYIVLFISCNNTGEIQTDTRLINNPLTASGNPGLHDLPVIGFEEDVHDFGQISQGEKVVHHFNFKNTGRSDLIITTASAACGCTVPKWPKKPIPPGGSDKIEVIFDSEGRSGRQHKKVTIVANTQPPTTVIALSGEVTAPVR